MAKGKKGKREGGKGGKGQEMEGTDLTVYGSTLCLKKFPPLNFL